MPMPRQINVNSLTMKSSDYVKMSFMVYHAIIIVTEMNKFSFNYNILELFKVNTVNTQN